MVKVGRTRRQAPWIVALLMGFAIAPATASAAVVNFTAGGLEFDAATGETNNVTVTNPTGNEIVFADTFPIPVTETVDGCSQTGFSSVSCDLGALPAYITIGLGDGADTLSAGTVSVPFSTFGGPGADSITTGSGNDSMSGEVGNDTDTLTGGAGNDTFDAGFGGDVIVGGLNTDTIDYGLRASGVTVDLGDNQVDDGNADDGAGDSLSGVENVIGTASADTIAGDGADNELQGGAGNDSLDGASGIDTVSYADHAQGVTVDLAAAGTTNGGPEDGAVNSRDQTLNFEHLVGSDADDVLTGNNAGNLMQGRGGNDTLNGLASDDLLDGGGGNDVLNGGEGDDLSGLYGFEGNDAISGGPGDDVIEGGADNDSAAGGAGSDTINGGPGDDQGAIGGLTGLDGGADNDVIRGGSGNDQLIGGPASDVVSFDDAGGPVTASLSGGTATGDGTDTLDGFEDLVGGGSGDTLTGTTGANQITGGAGDDLLAGLGGSDGLTGGDDSDTVTFATETATVASLAGTATNSLGTDSLTTVEHLIGSPLADTLTGDGTANVLSGGAGGDTLVGLVGNDDLFGDAGDDTLDGGLGNDDLNGGADRDTASYVALSCCRVIANLATDSATETDGGAGSDFYADTLPDIENLIATNQENDHLTGDGDSAGNRIEGRGGSDSIFAEDGPDTLIGGGGGDNVTAGEGDDLLEGNGGNDTLDGGNGDDTVTYANAAAGASIHLELGGTLGPSSDGDGAQDSLPGVDHVIGSSFSDDITGRSNQPNSLRGGSGNDLLFGRSEGDTLDGDGGTDTVSFQQAPAAITASLAGGTATGGAGGTDTILEAENLWGSNTHNDTLTGDGGANGLTGFTGDDTLRGGGGADVLTGSSGTDTATYSTAAGPVTASLEAGTAAVDGDGAADTLSGVEGLIGSPNADDLTGRTGVVDLLMDALGGDDTVRIRDGAADTVNCGGGADHAITDADEGTLTGCEIDDDPSLIPAPSISGSSPASGADDNSPEIKGSAPAGATVRLHTTADCSGTPVATGTAAEFAGNGITVTVADDSTTTLRASATSPLDSDGPSACSGALAYVENTPDPPVTVPPTPITPITPITPLDRTAPETTLTTKRTRTTDRTPTLRFRASEAGATFQCKLDKGAYRSCRSPLTLKKLKLGKHTLRVRATDRAGNVDATPAVLRFTVVRARR